MYLVVVGLLRHLLIAATQLSLLEGASKDAQSPSFTLLLSGFRNETKPPWVIHCHYDVEDLNGQKQTNKPSTLKNMSRNFSRGTYFKWRRKFYISKDEK